VCRISCALNFGVRSIRPARPVPGHDAADEKQRNQREQSRSTRFTDHGCIKHSNIPFVKLASTNNNASSVPIAAECTPLGQSGGSLIAQNPADTGKAADLRVANPDIPWIPNWHAVRELLMRRTRD
jgi:hypothetical protein